MWSKSTANVTVSPVCLSPWVTARNLRSMLSPACESCPFFRVDPLERAGMAAKRFDLNVQLERAAVIRAPQHMIDHFNARIRHCDAII